MSREILFKAKQKNWRELPKEGWWLKGYYVYEYNKNAHWILSNEPSTCLNAGSKVHRSDFILEPYEIDPETLCQYIGKDDKRGSQICEHDVISISTYSYDEPESDYYGEVVYAEGWACWCIQQLEEKRPIPLCECEGSYLTEITIEGNAIDNPELLEEV